jgi:predicted nucleotidyltransferase
MLIQRDQEIAGMPAVEARALMREIRECAVTVEAIAELLGIEPSEAANVVMRLADAGKMCRVDPFERSRTWHAESEADSPDDSLEYWGTTIAGNALAKARIGKPIPRAKAQELLDGLVDRARAINADPASPFLVARIAVFGSFVDETRSEVGDVDVHLVFERRVDGDRYGELAEQAATAAEAGGRRFRSLIERLGHLDTEFRRFLRGASHRLDIQFESPREDPRLPPGVAPIEVYSYTLDD